MKTIAIMQPYFFPYIGYFQLINAVDEFVIYDDIKFTKKGWINRNRILVNGKDEYITLTLKKDSDFLNVNERFLSETWVNDRKKMLNKIHECYRKAPYYKDCIGMIENCILFEDENLFSFIFNSVKQIVGYLDITTKIIVSSTLNIDSQYKNADKVLEICKKMGANNYINPIGGIELYSKAFFYENEININFQKSNPIEYIQFNNAFVPWLSIMDVLMFNNKERIKLYLKEFVLL
jgi:hypothetical protein